MGSVKDIEVLEEPTVTKLGRARFVFSDRYSVFDWGEMPDLIPQKGASSAILSSYFFEKCENTGIKTHYLKSYRENVIEVKLLRVFKPEFKDGHYDYSIYQKEKGCFLIPIEVIYRNYLPSGSSIFRRLKEGDITLRDLGLDKEPIPNQRLPKPILDTSTKLERIDRYITWDEACSISGLSNGEMEKLKNIASIVNRLITEEFSRIGLLNEDGKIELGFDEKRHLMVVDALGTLDECRATYEGFPVSKEIARLYYRKTEWYKAQEEAKKEDREHFKEICKAKPEPLPDKLKLLISQIYCSVCNEITKREWFKVPPLREIVKGIKEYYKMI
ncbi:MAG: phosphoribosylaminoimidazolesuccinocarboxamide synthase [bacterium]